MQTKNLLKIDANKQVKLSNIAALILNYDLAGKSVRYKSKEKRLNDMRHYKKKQMKRPGKVKRMMNRNKKNSKKSK